MSGAGELLLGMRIAATSTRKRMGVRSRGNTVCSWGVIDRNRRAAVRIYSTRCQKWEYYCQGYGIICVQVKKVVLTVGETLLEVKQLLSRVQKHLP